MRGRAQDRIGPYLLADKNNDFTAVVVRVKINGTGYDRTEVRRQACHYLNMQRIID
jgi:hypothetical protein